MSKYVAVHQLVRAVVLLALMLLALYFLMADQRNRQRYVYYDCTMASFHPDIPPAVKEACQKRHIYEQDRANIQEQERINQLYDPAKSTPKSN
jgi:hypothetical protein